LVEDTLYKNNGLGESDNFVFSALRGIQAGREYYVVMCPLSLISKLFVFNEFDIPPELRAQRTINKARVPEIVSYLVNNKNDYVFSSLTASIDGQVEFKPIKNEGSHSKVGELTIPMTAKFLINDGQHRRAAILEAIEKRPELAVESISVVFYVDRGLKHSQQMFSDLNKHAIRPTKSLNILYNNRDHFSHSLISALSLVPIFHNGLTDLEKTSISNRSKKVFTLNSIYHATKELLGKTQKNPTMSDAEMKVVVEYWNEVYANIPEWQKIVKEELHSSDARKEYVHVHGILLHALGMLGKELLENYKDEWKTKLRALPKIDWRRSNIVAWEGRAMLGGRLSKVHMNLLLTTNYLKKRLNMKLTIAQATLEKSLIK